MKKVTLSIEIQVTEEIASVNVLEKIGRTYEEWAAYSEQQKRIILSHIVQEHTSEHIKVQTLVGESNALPI